MITGDIKMDIFLSTIIFFPTVLVLICAGENYPREDSYGHADLLQVATAKDCVIDTPSCVNKSLFIVISRQRTGTHFLAQILMLNAHIYHGPETLFHHEMLSIQDFCMSINAYYEMICHEGSKLGGIEGYGVSVGCQKALHSIYPFVKYVVVATLAACVYLICSVSMSGCTELTIVTFLFIPGYYDALGLQQANRGKAPNFFSA